MNSSSRPAAYKGKHRKQTPNKGRVALVAFTTGAVSTAGVTAAAAANNASAKPSDIQLANDADAAEATDPIAAPQILAISEYKPVDNLAEQLGKAVKYQEVREAADQAARAPMAVKPAEGAFTSGFGMRWGSMHNGIDIANAVMTPIVSVMDGTVIEAGPAQGFGNWVRIRHDDGTVTVYGHMETIDCAAGQRVTAGQKIAGMGSRGFSTGSHLHFEVHPTGEGAIDPVPWLAARGINL
ncbi:M23 family metallopeptidase [Corynebacterium aquatimens]|uniref:Murein DD-endopeptidase MepM/ murein hydrolase activator NlpD n=1 Tax=Corynebacterium aquatimens TaxID=1190508 RepID=A0A931DY44_9CORY|nr:M23 family metallopeptidase [Corynebacterium aquatimens]MBG6121114.1 murein DD-endopeptidase MepM/ murein hydrolase activator NlpD [Corynebacterium aquatimens]WJY66330.1 Murein hydrolase activator NlpD precursor [Corynebacterium aquatimens]